MHYAAAWGKINAVKALVESGANVHTKTSNTNERAKDVASRYVQLECVDFLDWAGKWTVVELGVYETSDFVEMDRSWLYCSDSPQQKP